ncbi:MAG TPA: alpha/beta hydrolase [Vicinamibacteria bacterium]|nr:alpha/beta hydrolase [Vicinamibacteria bacterium]
MPSLRIAAAMALVAVPLAARAQDVSFDEVLKLPARPADARVAYGPGPQQYGELWVPSGPGPHPVAIVVHGGCWSAQYGEEHIRPLCAALAKDGVAAWCLEYRRVGDDGGGWPGTLEDVGHGADALREIAPARRLDLQHVVAMGHSAGGQLALWLAARAKLAKDDPLRGPDPLALRGVVGLAAIPDLGRAARDHVCGEAVPALLGGSPAAQPARYAEASPLALIPLGVPQNLIHGRVDRIVPFAESERYVAAARAKGDDARLVTLDEAGHFDLIAPTATSTAWLAIRRAVHGLLK